MSDELKRSTQVFNYTTFGLLLALILLSTWSLESADWTDNLSVVTLVAMLGLLAGTALARSRFSTRTALLFALVYGLFALGWQLGQTMDPALPWLEKIQNLIGRVGVFIDVVARGEPNEDALIFVMINSFVYFAFSCYAPWVIFRRGGVWGAIIPPGVAVLANAYFYIGRSPLSIYMGVYTFLAILLVIWSDLSRRQMLWDAIKAQVPAEASVQIGAVGAAAAFLLVGLAWAGPAFSRSPRLARLWREATAPWEEVRDVLGDALSSLRAPVARVYEPYSEKLSLDAGVPPEDTLVMQVLPSRLPLNESRFYWRSRVYDKYEDGSWELSDETTADFDPQRGDLLLPDYEARELIEVVMVPKLPALVSLYVPPQPLWVNRSAEVSVLSQDDVLLDVSRLAATSVVMEGESYRARASIAIPTASELRQAGSDYPPWVLERYLQIPDDLSDRTLGLARELASEQGNAFDIANAITAWMRENIEYNRTTLAPPPDQEPLDWFLFEYKLGFCNYYASAEVILLRSLGIPARLAAGYAAGEWNREEAVYSVYGVDAHAWPEVYFPGYGWVEFEPTVSQVELVRPEGGQPGDETGELGADLGLEDEAGLDALRRELALDRYTSTSGIPLTQRPAFWRALGALLAFIGLPAIWFRLNPAAWIGAKATLARGFERLGIDPPYFLYPKPEVGSTYTAVIYEGWSPWLRRLGWPVQPSHTPHERAQKFSELLPDQSEAGWTVVREYTRERFGEKSADEPAVYWAWRRMRPRLWSAWLGRIIRRSGRS